MEVRSHLCTHNARLLVTWPWLVFDLLCLAIDQCEARSIVLEGQNVTLRHEQIVNDLIRHEPCALQFLLETLISFDAEDSDSVVGS